MKKHVILALALGFSIFSFAQKKELKTAEKAIKNNNFSEAKSILNQVESMLSSMDEKSKDKFHYLKGQALYANGAGTDADLNMAIDNLNMVNSSYKVEVQEVKQNMINSIITESNSHYQSSQYSEAVKGFEKLYKLIPTDTTYLYYAAASAVNGKDYDTALKHYNNLNEIGYTGVEKEYFATNQATGEEEVLSSKDERDNYVKIGAYNNPGERQTESKKGEIIKNIAFIYVSQGKTTEALAAIKEARKNEPNDVSLILTEANLYHETGDLDSYKNLIEEAIKLDPNNLDLVFNLGVISSDNNDIEKAREYYQKVIDLDPTYINAQTNMAALILGEEQNIIEEMNSLGTSSADNKRYDELKAKRVNIYNEAVPYLEAVLKIDPKSIDVARTLMNIYSAVDNTAKFDEMKALVDALSGGN
ncbi:tetratricopeptide repeat protein [Lacinutrix iliipiscaria]|uniref:Tetratricopeptide repeat protein n=1 Tax=Lacinutrix iliipiscaria TaxID=1230532 RepID=A0ABW5WQL5_9FLAO